MELFIVLSIAGISLVGGWVIGELIDNKRYELKRKEELIKRDNKINCTIAEISIMLTEMIEKGLIKKQDARDIGRIVIDYCYKDIDIDNNDTLLTLVETRLNNHLELYSDSI